MPRRSLVLAAAALCVGAAHAQTPDQDVRCILVGNAFTASEKDPVKKQMAFATSLFFAGRADARLSPAQLKAQVLAQGKTLSAANAGPVMTACAKALQAKEQGMQAIGREVLQSQGKK